MKQSPMIGKINCLVSKIVIAGALALVTALYVFALGGPKAFSFCGDAKASTVSTAPTVAPASFITVKSTKKLGEMFQQHEYCLQTQCAKVPPLYLTKLPKDFGRNLTIAQKKQLFMRAILPLILAANCEIVAERTYLLSLKEILEDGDELDPAQHAWLKKIAKKYRLKKFTLAKMDQLVTRVDEIPVAMALAQAIEETGWGTSYAARFKNNTHGVTLPSGVKSYKSLFESVKAYMRNLNANPAYKKMRAIRAQLRTQNKDLCALKMMDGLYYYSELHGRYIKKVKHHIKHNALKRYDEARLASQNDSEDA